jgi:hypothetical protein
MTSIAKLLIIKSRVLPGALHKRAGAARNPASPSGKMSVDNKGLEQ